MDLYNGDCLEILKDLSDNSIDFICSDLPFGRLNQSWDKPINLEKMWEQLWRVGKRNCPVFLFADFKFAVELYTSQPEYFKYEIVWNKGQTTTPLMSKKRFGKATEYILAFYKNQTVYNYTKYHKIIEKQTPSIIKDGIYKWKGRDKTKKANKYEPTLPINVIKCKTKRKNKTIKKITEKPQMVLEHLLKYFSNENDVCLDFCMGSGSLGVACKKLNRKFIGIEKNKEFFEITKKRLTTI